MAKIIPDFYFAEKHRLLYPVNTGELVEILIWGSKLR